MTFANSFDPLQMRPHKTGASTLIQTVWHLDYISDGKILNGNNLRFGKKIITLYAKSWIFSHLSVVVLSISVQLECIIIRSKVNCCPIIADSLLLSCLLLLIPCSMVTEGLQAYLYHRARPAWRFKSLLAGGAFWRLLMTFANNLDLDEAPHLRSKLFNTLISISAKCRMEMMYFLNFCIGKIW